MRYRICRRLTFVVSIGASFAAAAVHADDVQIVRERTLDAHRGRVTGIVFGGTSNQFISASMDGSVAIWATASAKPDIRFERSAGVQSISIDSEKLDRLTLRVCVLPNMLM